jgi:hypothetical protein
LLAGGPKKRVLFIVSAGAILNGRNTWEEFFMKRLAIVVGLFCFMACPSYSEDSKVLKPQTTTYKIRFNSLFQSDNNPLEFWVYDKLNKDKEIAHGTLKTPNDDVTATATAMSPNQFEKPKTSVKIKAVGKFKGNPRTNCYDTSTTIDGELRHVYLVNDGGKPC